MKAEKTQNAVVSVIMPVYNTISFLTEAVESVLHQTYADWELILIDDGSTDGSAAACDRFAALDPRIHVIHQENRGLSAARNTGMARASGAYLQFLDSDDWLFPDALESLVREISSSGADLVIFDVQYEWSDRSQHERSPLAPGIYDPVFILKKICETSLPPYACNKFCLRQLYDGVSFPEGEKWEDVPTVIYPVSRAGKIAVTDRPLYHYRQREDAITKLAMRDGSIYKWRFLQYGKRYAFLMENFPQIAPAARPSLIRNGLKYYALCLRAKEDRPERRRVLSFVRAPEMGRGLPGVRIRLVRRMFCIFPQLTAFLFRIWDRNRK